MKHNWEYKRLGDLCNISSSRRVLQSDWKESGVPFYRAREIVKLSENGFVNNELFISENLYDELAKSGIPQAGDIMLSAVGTLGATYIVKPTDKFYYKDASVICLSKISDLQPKFLCYLFDSNIILHQIDRQAKGATVGTITISNASKFKVPVPDYKVQEQIVAELDKINETIGDCRELLRNLDALAQSLFYDFFGDPVNNPKKFSIVPLSDVFSIITDGTHQTPTYTEDIENRVKFLSAKDVVNGYINWDNIKYIPFDLHLQLHKRLAPQRGDILLCKNGTTGICALVETDDIFDIYVSLALLRPKSETSAKYLVYAINNPFTKEQFNHSLKGIGVPNLHLNKIRNTKIILPPLALQEQFAARIEQIEAQKKVVENTIAELQTLLDSRMDYWFN